MTELTKDKTKTPFHLIGLDFVAAMARNMEKGIKNGRAAWDWAHIDFTPDADAAYHSALLRHVQARNWPAVACNAYILWKCNR